MLFMFFCAVASAWIGWELEKTRREQVVVAQIKLRGCFVMYHDTYGPLWIRQRFRRVSEIDQVRTLSQGQTPPPPITNDDLKDLKELTCIEGLWLDYMRISDTGLEYLKESKNLELLDLSGNRITDAGLVHLKELTKLHSLTLDGTQVTDEGVERLRKALPNCKIYH